MAHAARNAAKSMQQAELMPNGANMPNMPGSPFIKYENGAPQDVHNYWYPKAFPFGDVICIIGSVLAETATNANVLTITTFAVERDIAICHPFRQHTMSKLSPAIKYISSFGRQICTVSAQGVTSCTLPLHAQRLMAVYGSSANIESQLFKDVFEADDLTSGVLHSQSTCINQLLNNIVSNKFRDAFKVS
nr:pyrokinin-1 receptor-like [Bactrocera oleae]